MHRDVKCNGKKQYRKRRLEKIENKKGEPVSTPLELANRQCLEVDFETNVQRSRTSKIDI